MQAIRTHAEVAEIMGLSRATVAEEELRALHKLSRDPEIIELATELWPDFMPARQLGEKP